MSTLNQNFSTPVEAFRHPCTGKRIEVQDVLDGAFFKVGRNGMPHGGAHWGGPQFYSMAEGVLLAARVQGKYPFLLLRHALIIPGSEAIWIYVVIAQFRSWADLTETERQKIKVLPNLQFPGFFKDSPERMWIPQHGIPLMDEQSGEVLLVIPQFHVVADMGKSSAPHGNRGKGWRKLKYNQIQGVACLGKGQSLDLKNGQRCILGHNAVIPTTQPVDGRIPLYKSPQAALENLVECQEAYIPVEAHIVNAEWMAITAINGIPCKNRFVLREHLAIGADPFPAGDDVWYGNKPVLPATLLAYGNEIHVEFFMDKNALHAQPPLLAPLLAESAWETFCNFPSSHTLEGWNEWKGFSPTLRSCTPPEQLEFVQSCADEACWWTSHLQNTLHLPDPDSLFHVHPILFAQHWNQLIASFPRNRMTTTFTKWDWRQMGYLCTLIKKEMIRHRIIIGAPEVPQLCAALLGRLYADALDWKHCHSPEDLLHDIHGTNVPPLQPEEWLSPDTFTQSELQDFLRLYALPPRELKKKMRLFHPTNEPLSQQGWNLAGLQCDRQGVPLYETIGTLRLYAPRADFHGYLARPVPILVSGTRIVQVDAVVAVKIAAWQPQPLPAPEARVDWQVWLGSHQLSRQKGGDTCVITAPHTAQSPIITVIALYEERNRISHGQCSILIEGYQNIGANTRGGQDIDTTQLANASILQEYLRQLGYWAFDSKNCKDALSTMQFEYGLPVSGTLDQESIQHIANLFKQGAPNLELRGRPGIEVCVPQSKGGIVSTRFYQLPAPCDNAYGAYGELREVRDNQTVLDKTIHNEKWGQKKMVVALETLLRKWHSDTGDTITVNDISYYLGGESSSHHSHRWGLDVDLRSRWVGAREIAKANNPDYDSGLTAQWIDRALDAGFGIHCTFDSTLVKKFQGDKRGVVKVVSGHQHHLHMSFTG